MELQNRRFAVLNGALVLEFAPSPVQRVRLVSLKRLQFGGRIRSLKALPPGGPRLGVGSTINILQLTSDDRFDL